MKPNFLFFDVFFSCNGLFTDKVALPVLESSASITLLELVSSGSTISEFLKANVELYYTEWVSEQVSEWLMQWVSDWVSEWVLEWVSVRERNRERDSERDRQRELDITNYTK